LKAENSEFCADFSAVSDPASKRSCVERWSVHEATLILYPCLNRRRRRGGHRH